MQEIENTSSPADETEYRFIHRPSEMRQIWLVPLVVLIYPAVKLYFSSPPPSPAKVIVLLSICAAFGICSAFLLFFLFRRQRITVNAAGMAFTGIPVAGYPSFMSPLPNFISWDKISSLRLRETAPFMRIPLSPYFLVLVNQYQQEYCIPLGHGKKPQYVGEGHALSLIEAIEKFHGPLQTLSDEEMAKSQNLKVFQKLDPAHERATIAAVVMALPAFMLLFLAADAVLLDAGANPLYFYGVAALLAFGSASLYMRRARQRMVSLLISLLCAGTAAWLTQSLTHSVPRYLGEARPERFAIAHEDDKEQRWQNEQEAEITFSLFIKPEKRLYKDTGATQTLTLYRGPLGLLSIDRQELHTLFKAD
jgi:hypothetical protein